MPSITTRDDFDRLFHYVTGSKSPLAQYLLRPVFWSHRLTVLLCVCSVFTYHIFLSPLSVTTSTLTALLFAAVLAFNIFYGLAVRLPSLFRASFLRTGPRSADARFVIDVLFVTSYLTFELFVFRSSPSVLAFFYSIPLLMIGFYCPLRKSVAYAAATTCVEIVLFLVAKKTLLSEYLVISSAMNFGAVVLMDIVTGPYRSAITTIEREMAAVYRSSFGFALAELDEPTFLRSLLTSLQSIFSTDLVSILRYRQDVSHFSVVLGKASRRTIAESPRGSLGIEQAMADGSFVSSTYKESPRASVHGASVPHHMSFQVPDSTGSNSLLIEVARRNELLGFLESDVELAKCIVRHYPNLRKIRDEIQVKRLVDNISRVMSKCKDSKVLVQEFLAVVSVLAESPCCSYWALDRSRGVLRVRAYLGLDSRIFDELHELDGSSRSSAVLRTGRVELIPDFHAVGEFKFKELISRYHPELKSILIVPLTSTGGEVGVLHFWAMSPERLDGVQRLFPVLSNHLGEMLAGYSQVEHMRQNAIDNVRKLASQDLLKDQERVSVRIALHPTAVEDCAEMYVEARYVLSNLSDSAQTAPISIAFQSILDLAAEKSQSRPSCIEHIRVTRNNELCLAYPKANGIDCGEINELGDFVAGIPMLAGDSVHVEFAVRYLLPCPGQEVFLTRHMSRGPQYVIEWTDSLLCNCSLLSHLAERVELASINLPDQRRYWQAKYPEDELVFPFQGVHVSWRVPTTNM